MPYSGTFIHGIELLHLSGTSPRLIKTITSSEISKRLRLMVQSEFTPAISDGAVRSCAVVVICATD